MLDWHLYLVRCHDGSLYTGIATNVARRFAEHQGKGDAGAKYLRGRVPLMLVFQKKLGSRSLALSVESKVKKLSKARKEKLIRDNEHIDEIIKQVNKQEVIMEWQEILSVEFERISRSLGIALEGLTAEDLNWQPKPDSNSIGWLTWHLTRWQDVQIASFMKKEQVWIKDGWHKKFGRPADAKDHGTGHKPEDLAKFKSPDAATQLGYHQAVLAQTKDFLRTLSPSDLDKVVEGTPFQPPPTVGMSIIGVLSDGMQHAGQAAYVRGLRQGMGWH